MAEAPRKITGEEREFQAYRTLRNERASARHDGKRKQREAKVGRLFGYNKQILNGFHRELAEGRGGGKQEEVICSFISCCRLLFHLHHATSSHVFSKSGYLPGLLHTMPYASIMSTDVHTILTARAVIISRQIVQYKCS